MSSFAGSASLDVAQVRSLANYCLDLKFSRPTKSIIAKRAVDIGRAENMDIEPNAAEALAESCGNDIRQVLNALQMWATKAKGSASNPGERITMKYKEFKDRSSEIGKDEMLRVSMFDAGRMIMEGRRNIKDATEQAKKVNFLKVSSVARAREERRGAVRAHREYVP